MSGSAQPDDEDRPLDTDIAAAEEVTAALADS
jgi:hypothetical protein